VNVYVCRCFGPIDLRERMLAFARSERVTLCKRHDYVSMQAYGVALAGHRGRAV
jgi:hypothetical protein